jgi:hypothetical protein
MTFLQLGPVPSPPPPEPMSWISAVPFIIAGGAVLAMLLSILLRYNARFREFWDRHVCDWMEEHVVKSDETKGGR